MEVTGTVKGIAPVEEYNGKEKLRFILKTDEEYSKEYPMEIYDRKAAYPRVGDKITVDFYLATGRQDKNGKVWANCHNVKSIRPA